MDQAEWDYLAKGQTEFVFTIRRPSGAVDFYERLDEELRRQSWLQIATYRRVKEGFIQVARPASLKLEIGTLLAERPYLVRWRQEIEELNRVFTFIPLEKFILSEGRGSIADLPLLRACLEVFSHLISHASEIRGLLPRQLAHGRSTKLIGRENLLLRLFAAWRGGPAGWRDFFLHFELLDKPSEFRIYAPQLRVQSQALRDYHGILARDWAGDYDFHGLAGTLIVENFESFLALTSEVRSTLLIWGAGWRAVHLRALIEKLPGPVYYWGDIDKEGYEIFGHLKNSYPPLKSTLMD